MTPTNIHFNFILVRIFHHSSTLPKTALYFWASASATSRLNCSSTQNCNPDKICNRIWKHDIIYDATMGYQGITCQQCELKRNCTGCRGRKRYTIYNGGTSNQTKSKNTNRQSTGRMLMRHYPSGSLCTMASIASKDALSLDAVCIYPTIVEEVCKE